jgi:hypothetical protein
VLSFQAVVFILCLATSAACAVFLLRSYSKGRAKLLLWSAICFVFLALNNLLVVLDLLVLPEVDLLAMRHLAALAGICALLFGFIWEAE